MHTGFPGPEDQVHWVNINRTLALERL